MKKSVKKTTTDSTDQALVYRTILKRANLPEEQVPILVTVANNPALGSTVNARIRSSFKADIHGCGESLTADSICSESVDRWMKAHPEMQIYCKLAEKRSERDEPKHFTDRKGNSSTSNLFTAPSIRPSALRASDQIDAQINILRQSTSRPQGARDGFFSRPYK